MRGHRPAASMLYHAAIANAYDIAVLLAGDLDYLPLIQRVRLLGNSTLLVALKEAGRYYPTSKRLMEESNLFDLPHLFLDDNLEQIRLKRTAAARQCDNCGKSEKTTWAGDLFYCTACRTPTRHDAQTDLRRLWQNRGDQLDRAVFYCNECRESYRTNRGGGGA